ncbi:MAG: glutamate--tRNA ligase [bacterium]
MESNIQPKDTDSNKVRVRIAPSPTGLLHFGNARSALFNYLFSRQNQGAFILRIEDTDIERSKPEFEKDIIDNLKWLGIDWDEGPDIDGPHGPYRQSEKIVAYRRYLEQLINEDKAYYCFCNEEELEAQRQYQISSGLAPRYDGKCGQIAKDEAEERIKSGEKAVIRFRVPPKKIKFDDLIRGGVEFDASLFGDLVIAKNLNSPLYNFAVVIDDYEMKITHVIRGEDHLSNTPKQILIQEALDFPKVIYAHMALILAPDRTKMSKRFGATSVEAYREDGYLPEAFINFMAFLGWNPGNDREIYTIPSLIKDFSIEHCHKAGAVFNIKKLDSLNGFYIRQKSLDKLVELCIPFWIKAGLINEPESDKKPETADNVLVLQTGEKPEFIVKETNASISWDTLEKIVAIYQERMKKLSEIPELSGMFFKDKLTYEKDLLKWQNDDDDSTKKALIYLVKILSQVEDDSWSKDGLEKILINEAASFSEIGDRGHLLWPLRVAVSGKKASAAPFEIAAILGKEMTIKRLNEAILLFDK